MPLRYRNEASTFALATCFRLYDVDLRTILAFELVKFIGQNPSLGKKLELIGEFASQLC
jgi:hypothetical protein